MNYGLLWIDILMIALLWLMALAAVLGRIQRKWIRRPLWCIAIAVPTLLLGGLVTMAASLKYRVQIDKNWFMYAATLAIAYLLGAIVIEWRASRRDAEHRPAAANWRRGPLLLGCLFAMGIGYMTLTNMDLALRARCALLSTQINTMYIAMSPSITSESENAATLYQDIFRRLGNDSHIDDIQNPPIGNKLDDDFDPKEPATIAFLSRQAKTISELRAAAAMPGCRFEQDVEEPNLDVMLNLNMSRLAANTLNLHAREEIANGRIASAVADAAAICGMSRHIAQRPMVISAMVGAGIGALGNSTLERVLPAVTRPEELDALHLEKLEPLGFAFQQSLRGEERYGLARYSDMPSSTPTGQGALDGLQPLFSTGISQSFFCVFMINLDGYLKLTKNLQGFAVQPYCQVKDRLKSLAVNDPDYDLITLVLAPSLIRTFETFGKIEASDACALTAVAMTRYRLDHGSFPDHLDRLVPAYLDAVPTSPFDGLPLRLAIKNNQWIIYSIGPDGVDHGGVENRQTRRGDITFILKAT